MAARKPLVLALVGSARKQGNCDLLCDAALAGAKADGARVGKLYLCDFNIRPCTACEGCQGRGGKLCALKDDMAKVYPLLLECDRLVLASPIYYFTVSGYLKLLMDRFYPFVNPKQAQPKFTRVLACLTYGADDVFSSGCENAVGTLKDMFTFMNIPVAFAHASAWKKGDIRRNRAALRKAREAGKELVA
jgi:multimeric flavodoxin WrbA